MPALACECAIATVIAVATFLPEVEGLLAKSATTSVHQPANLKSVLAD